MSNININLWKYNEEIFIKTNLNESVKRIANIDNHIYVQTIINNLYEGFIEETAEDENGKHQQIELKLLINLSYSPIDITSFNNKLYILTTEGTVLICNEKLQVLNEITLLEKYQCHQGHNSVNLPVKIKNFVINEFGGLFISETNQLWANGTMQEIKINSELIPQKVHFFSSRMVYCISVGKDFAVIVVSKENSSCGEEENSLLKTSLCQECSPHINCNTLQVDEAEEKRTEKAEAEAKEKSLKNTAKEFLTKQISRLSSVGEEYFIESRIIKENVTSMANFVYQGVKTLVNSTESEQQSNRNASITDEFLQSINNLSQNTTEIRDLIDLTENNLEDILIKGRDLINREVWMWGSNNNNKNPIIISSLTNQGIIKLNLNYTHLSALSLDGRVFLWGENSEQQISCDPKFVTKEKIEIPKLFNCNLDERIYDVQCGKEFTTVLTNKLNLIYFGKYTQNYHTIFNKFMIKRDVESSLQQSNFLITSNEYILLNLSRTLFFDDYLNGFLVKEQSYLEEMLLVNLFVIKIIVKKSKIDTKNAELYDNLCRCYVDVLNFIAVNLENLCDLRNNFLIELIEQIPIVKFINEFISVLKNYINVVEDIISLDGFEELFNVLPKKNYEKLELKIATADENDLKQLFIANLTNRFKKNYMEFFRKLCNTEIQEKWKHFLEYIAEKSKDAQTTREFWNSASGKNLFKFKLANRRIICDSETELITLQSCSRFSSHRFLLFNDIFLHLNGSTVQEYDLRLIWLELPHQHQELLEEDLNLIHIKAPEETLLILLAPDAILKNKWYHLMQQTIKTLLNKSNLIQPPLARNGGYTFSQKNGFFKGAHYLGRWINGKMHGKGKILWPDQRSYSGELQHNFLHGFGVMNIPNFGIYEGEWKDNKQNGFGTFTFVSNDFYKGYFKDDLQHGHGLLCRGSFMANLASLYIGEWEQGKKSGYGVMDEISTGEKYLGMWSDDKKEGNGLIVTSEGAYYEGNFHHDTLTGQGIMVLEDHTHFEGEFKSTNVLGGKGLIHLPSGHKIEGELHGSMEEGGVKIISGILRKNPEEENVNLPKYFGKLCTAPSEKWKALFKQCYYILGVENDEDEAAEDSTQKIWQKIAVYLSTSTSNKKNYSKMMHNLDVIPPFGRESLNYESYQEIKTYLNKAFDSGDLHPIGSLVNNLCEAFITSYSGKVHGILVNHAILELLDLIQRVYDVILHLFPALPKKTTDYYCVFNNATEEMETITYQSLLYPIILPKVYNCLSTLLSLKNDVFEQQYKKTLIKWNKLSNQQLMDLLSVEKKFFKLCEEEKSSLLFLKAIESLQQIVTVFLPREKLNVIKTTVEKMSPVAKELLGESYLWNMDDLFPLFLYVVVRARIPHLGAELEFIENFMETNLDNGELAHMFTTLKACYQQILQDE